MMHGHVCATTDIYVMQRMQSKWVKVPCYAPNNALISRDKRLTSTLKKCISSIMFDDPCANMSMAYRSIHTCGE